MHPRAPPCTLYSPLVCLSCDINLHLAENIEPDMIACARHLSLTLMARSPYALYALPFVSTALRRRALGELTAIHTNDFRGVSSLEQTNQCKSKFVFVCQIPRNVGNGMNLATLLLKPEVLFIES